MSCTISFTSKMLIVGIWKNQHWAQKSTGDQAPAHMVMLTTISQSLHFPAQSVFTLLGDKAITQGDAELPAFCCALMQPEKSQALSGFLLLWLYIFNKKKNLGNYRVIKDYVCLRG